ncbi:MAG: diacylglycerol/lipid kinase family protein [Burkholderiales bacterium]
MRCAALIYNPSSGTRREQRVADVEAAARALRDAGIAAETVPTRGPGTAAEQAREAIAAGCDAILACGGDGTLHEAMQGVLASAREAALGVIPLGTGNALANDLGIPLRQAALAARELAHGTTRRVAVAKIEYQQREGGAASRYFTVMAGVGPDAFLLYSMNLAAKGKMGMGAYYWQAAKLLTFDYPEFEVEFTDAESGARRVQRTAALMAVRIGYFGGALRHLAPGASLERDDMRVILFRRPIHGRIFLYLLGTLLGRHWNVPGVDLAYAREILCRPLATSGEAGRKPRTASLYAEADGELLGRLPVRFTIEPGRLILLVPRSSP